jgi:MoxR-like ATPase
MLGERPPAALLLDDSQAGSPGRGGRSFRAIGVPDTLRSTGDRCLYDVGLAGRTAFRGIPLQEVGPRSYDLAGQVLELLAADRTLVEFYERNRMQPLPIEEEILFLRQSASRFQLYARILQAFRSSVAPRPTALVRASVGAVPLAPVPIRPIQGPNAPKDAPRIRTIDGASDRRVDPAPPPAAREETRGLDREERLAGYERALLLGSLDLDHLRRRLKEEVVDQDEAVDRVVDDLSVFACGTRARPRPESYFLVGPTGVGKNYLMERLARLLEEAWETEIPFLILEGPQYAYPADVNELKGATRGFIRSDEPGLLAEFHERSRIAPLSILLVDEIEKAHPQLARFFLAMMDRGATLDNRGRSLRFSSSILAFTSNLGYSEIERQAEPIGYGARRTGALRRRAAARDLRRGLPPEFLSRLKVVHFAPLTRRSAERILDLEAARIASRYRSQRGLDLLVTSAARQAIVDTGFSEAEGARHLVERADRVLNVEVSLRLRPAAEPLTESGRRLLERIREARRGERAVDEEALRSDIEREAHRQRRVRRLTVDWRQGEFVYRVEGD